MDFSIFNSLKPCSLDDVKNGLKAAQKNIELYVDTVDPKRFKELYLSQKTEVRLTTTNAILDSDDEEYLTFFHQVLYESLHLDVDLKKIQFIKLCKNIVIGFLLIFTLAFIFLPTTALIKTTLFSGISGMAWGLYRLYQFKVRIEVSEIQRKTNFKLLKDKKLEILPAVYIIDNKTMYIGSNFLGSKEPESFYLVESFEDQVALKTIYRDYAKNSLGVGEDFLISSYLRIVGNNQ